MKFIVAVVAILALLFSLCYSQSTLAGQFTDKYCDPCDFCVSGGNIEGSYEYTEEGERIKGYVKGKTEFQNTKFLGFWAEDNDEAGVQSGYVDDAGNIMGMYYYSLHMNLKADFGPENMTRVKNAGENCGRNKELGERVENSSGTKTTIGWLVVACFVALGFVLV